MVVFSPFNQNHYLKLSSVKIKFQFFQKNFFAFKGDSPHQSTQIALVMQNLAQVMKTGCSLKKVVSKVSSYFQGSGLSIPKADQ